MHPQRELTDDISEFLGVDIVAANAECMLGAGTVTLDDDIDNIARHSITSLLCNPSHDFGFDLTDGQQDSRLLMACIGLGRGRSKTHLLSFDLLPEICVLLVLLL